MQKPQMLLDSFVRKLKADSAFEGIRFVHSKKNAQAENPVKSYFVTCSVVQVEKDKDSTGNSNTCTELEFCVYAPDTAGGRELSQVALKIMEVLDGADSDGVISNIRVCDSEYDKNLFTLFQRVRIGISHKVEILLPEPEPVETTVSIVINNEAFKVLKAEASVKENVYRLCELLGGKPGFMKRGVSCTVSIAVERDKDPFENYSFFDISLGTDKESRNFYGCRVVSMTEKIVPDKSFVREYVLETEKTDWSERSGMVYG